MREFETIEGDEEPTPAVAALLPCPECNDALCPRCDRCHWCKRLGPDCKPNRAAWHA